VKIVTLCVGLCLVASSAFAALKKDEVKRLDESARVLTELRGAPDKGIADDLWKKSECVIVFPSVKKAAFVLGGEFGSGVMSCRQANGWSAPIFMRLTRGSVGFQLGAEETDLVLLVMNKTGAEKILQDKVSLGADVSAAGGPVGREGTAATDAQMNAEILAYSRARGVFAGIDVSGGSLRPDTDANERAYGAAIHPHDVITGAKKFAEPPAVRSFIGSLESAKTPASL
jgi:SH3 domain-containing YSC84-like protein 1